MNLQERNQLNQFLSQLSEVRLSTKDAEAEALIQEAVARQADAAYLLVQRALLQDQALNAAKTQIADLQNQLQNSAGNQRSGFLGTDPWAQPTSNHAGVPGVGNYQTPRTAPAPAQPAGFFGGGGGSSFLGNVATTAAGVVAGSFLFQGIESLMGHHGAASGWGQQASGEHTAAPEQTVVNNYYGDDAIQQASAEHNNDDYSFNEADYSVPDDNDASDDSNWI